MAVPIQYDLFEKVDEITILQHEVQSLRESNSNVRKAAFAGLNSMALQLSELTELVMEHHAKIDEMVRTLNGIDEPK